MEGEEAGTRFIADFYFSHNVFRLRSAFAVTAKYSSIAVLAAPRISSNFLIFKTIHLISLKFAIRSFWVWLWITKKLAGSRELYSV